MEGDLQIAKVTQFAQYYILASLPPLYAAQPPQQDQVYHTFTRTSIAKGTALFTQDARGITFACKPFDVARNLCEHSHLLQCVP